VHEAFLRRRLTTLNLVQTRGILIGGGKALPLGIPNVRKLILILLFHFS